jgi:anti-sigma B factor antagonist/serine/threonine-protein kinase RsbW
MQPNPPAAQRLRIPAELARLADVRQLVRQATRSAGAGPDTVDDLVQAVDEAATNAIVHGYAGRAGELEVDVAFDGRTLVITLQDEAPAFDPTSLPDPDMSVPALVRGPGGMGIRLMRLATDTLAYRPRPGGGNILTLTRDLAPRQQEDRSMALQTIVEHTEGPVPVTVVALDGELDAASFESVIETVRGIYDSGGRRLLLDLTNLSFISSSGLVAVHSAMRLMRGEAPPDPEQGWEALRAIRDEVEGGAVTSNLRLCGTQDAVQKVLDRTGLGGLIPSYADRVTALAAF